MFLMIHVSNTSDDLMLVRMSSWEAELKPLLVTGGGQAASVNSHPTVATSPDLQCFGEIKTLTLFGKSHCLMCKLHYTSSRI
ncbi:hypothetical protein Hamer_G013831 [Homarus americanus]|uniref:Uncharacterized protein n=1 Tax=Homarus americanus TaxID=6706 RepID=A0A8J5K9I4_HOMAM|nr:hypothetical protein Hamer_G013831 [Homarus americanus]